MKKILLLLAVISITATSFAQSAATGAQIAVEGKSSVKLMPEDLSFTVNLSVKDNNYTKCAEMAVEKMDNIKKLFVKNGIDKDLIKANNYSIREIQKYDPELRQSVFDGYEANIPVTIRTKRDYKKNDKIFELIKDNLESNFNLNFSLSEEQMDAVKEKLITLAVQDARQKAEWIAKASRASLGKIKNIQYGEPQRSIGPVQPELRMFAMMDQEGAAAKITDVLNPDEVEMHTNIFISWEINQ
ncbi:SIMPL domain-containing protein [Maribellus sp. CM-23]|uniref:SIMPL domain-containing protein n=1 Tax=Maribellus sp. CM-23 TaxID=2781026 RepID=UPI001F286B70|nr:SIMPL domain-containing protein [Maribellus sp. CM-23]MCE4564573.1 SIMPL domain-containing protein [Maribellus sp. CM-23]